MRRLAHIFALLCLLACSSNPHVVHPQPGNGKAGKDKIYITNHGWHTGIVVPAAALERELPKLGERFTDAAFYELGWGDAGFYQAEEITAGLAFKALFWPTKTVVHVVAVPKDIEMYFKNNELVALCIGGNARKALVKFLVASFAVNKINNVIALKKGLYGDSQFYRGTGTYHLTNTCNKWTAKGLKSAGFNISPSFKFTTGSIMAFAKAQNEPVSPCEDTNQIRK